MLIKNLAEFKRAMTVGTRWLFLDSRLGENWYSRECTNSQSNSFALNNHPTAKNKEEGAWLEYPKAKDLTFIQEEGRATKVRINLSNDIYFIYQKVEKA